MARTRYVHRTIVSTEAEVKTLNVATDEIGSIVIPVQGTYEDKADKKLVKAVKKGFDSLNLGDVTYVTITAINPVVKEYRMLESQFMALAEATVVEGESIIADDEDAEDEDEGDEE